jgi:hypothetical protein
MIPYMAMLVKQPRSSPKQTADAVARVFAALGDAI